MENKIAPAVYAGKDRKEVNRFNKTARLFGKRKDGELVYIEAPSWDCDWYWSFGYMEIYNRTATDINEHYHFSSMFKEKNGFDNVHEEFAAIVLNEKELWEFLDLMATAYRLREAAEVYHTGGAHYTSSPIHDSLKNPEFEKKLWEDTARAARTAFDMLKN